MDAPRVVAVRNWDIRDVAGLKPDGAVRQRVGGQIQQIHHTRRVLSRQLHGVVGTGRVLALVRWDADVVLPDRTRSRAVQSLAGVHGNQSQVADWRRAGRVLADVVVDAAVVGT